MISAVIMPVLVLFVFAWGIYKRVDIMDAFTEGARENLKITASLLPTLCLLMLAVGMLKASGAIEALTALAAPMLEKIGFPADCLPLALLRPVSGSGALSIMENILHEKGADSFSGRVASVLMGSTETTFYTVAVYFAATKVKKTRHALTSALTGDLTAFIISAIAVRLMLG